MRQNPHPRVPSTPTRPRRKKIPVKILHAERTLQARLVARIRAILPDLPFWPGLNGIKLDPRTAYIAQTQGNRKGIPDLSFPTLRLAIELKRSPAEKPSPEQLREHAALRHAGWEVLVTHDIELAWNTITTAWKASAH